MTWAVIKDVLGIYVGENESAKFWLSVLNGLKNRGVEDILIVCVDGLNGFLQAIEAVYPEAEVRHCIIYIRSVSLQNSYPTKISRVKLIFNLKLVYTAPHTEEIAFE